jgi:hypothetical protein
MSKRNRRDFFSQRIEGTSRPPGRDVPLDKPVLGKSIVWFTRHALDRLKQRGITEAEVLRVLQQPTHKGLPTTPQRRRWRRAGSARASIDVVFEIWPEKLCIVTVFQVE